MKKVWIDTDPGVDDTFAMAMVFGAKDRVEVIGVSTIFGNVKVEDTTRNAKILLEAAGLNHLPLARGASRPLAVPLDISPYVHGSNGMGDMPLPQPSMPESQLLAPQAIIEVVLSHPNEITLMPIGPLTNIAMAVLLEPRIVNLTKEVIIMGGAVRCPGNITPVAEANFFHDPHAAQIVMSAGWDITLAGLDVCNLGLIPQALLDKICTADKPLNRFIAGAVPFYQRFLESIHVFGKIDVPDALAAAYLLEPAIFTVEEIPLFVETEGSCLGQSIPVPMKKWYQELENPHFYKPDASIQGAKVLVDVDTQRFLKLVERLLC